MNKFIIYGQWEPSFINKHLIDLTWKNNDRSLIHETHKGRNMHIAQPAQRSILCKQHALAVSNTGTLLFSSVYKKLAFFNRFTRVHACVSLNVIYSYLGTRMCFSRKTHLPMRVPVEMYWRPRSFLLKSNFMDVRFMFVRRVRECAGIRAENSSSIYCERYIYMRTREKQRR